MTDKKAVPTEKVKDLPPKANDDAIADKVKGGGPGTQTEDDIYVGIRRR